MKLFQIKFVAILLPLFLCLGCENDATVEPPPFVKKPVFTSLISPQGDSIQVMAYYTTPYWGKTTGEVDPIGDAIITVTDLTTAQTVAITLIYPGLYGIPVTNMPIVNGHAYVMEAKMSNGQVFKAKTIVPPAPDVTKMVVTNSSVSVPNQNSGVFGQGTESNTLTLRMDYLGNLGKDNFVSPHLNATFENANLDQLNVPIYFDMDFNFLEGNSENKVEYFTQQDFFSGWGQNGPWHLVQLDGAIYTADKAFKYYNISQFNSQNGADFFSEPQPVIGNFSEGALGVFASYSYATGIVYKK